jgi:hypothetical protein
VTAQESKSGFSIYLTEVEKTNLEGDESHQYFLIRKGCAEHKPRRNIH